MTTPEPGVGSSESLGKPDLATAGFDPGWIVRLRRLLFGNGPGRGTLLIAPLDGGLEHGPVDYFENPRSNHADYQLELAHEARVSAVVLHLGLAEHYSECYSSRLPLILKLNGKTNLPSDSAAFSPATATVEDALRLGADAVGYTVYVGSPSEASDFEQFRRVRTAANRCGMPVMVWAYPRGDAIERKGGRDTAFAIEYAARVALELGADIVKVNPPNLAAIGPMTPPPYSGMHMTSEEAFRRVVRSAGRAIVVQAGGPKTSTDTVVHVARSCMNAGARGITCGRNLWQRPHEDALALARQLHALLQQYPRPMPVM